MNQGEHFIRIGFWWSQAKRQISDTSWVCVEDGHARRTPECWLLRGVIVGVAVEVNVEDPRMFGRAGVVIHPFSYNMNHVVISASGLHRSSVPHPRKQVPHHLLNGLARDSAVRSGMFTNTVFSCGLSNTDSR